GAGGKVALFNARGATHLIADIVGWYPGAAPEGGAGLAVPLPDRLLSATPTVSGGRELADEVWVTLGGPTSPGPRTQAESAAAAVGATVVGGFEEFGVYQLRWPQPVDIAAMTAQLESLPGVGDAMPSTW